MLEDKTIFFQAAMQNRLSCATAQSWPGWVQLGSAGKHSVKQGEGRGHSSATWLDASGRRFGAGLPVPTSADSSCAWPIGLAWGRYGLPDSPSGPNSCLVLGAPLGFLLASLLLIGSSLSLEAAQEGLGASKEF